VEAKPVVAIPVEAKPVEAKPTESTSFSGYIAADELYDGPFCVLSIVDNRNFRRLSYRVLDHTPAARDVEAFLATFKAELDARGLTLRGITTDGSSLYPEPIATVFGDGVSHQLCCFHVTRKLVRAVLHALARLRKRMAARLPTPSPGRPSRARRRRDARVYQAQQRLKDLFEHRKLLVRRQLTGAQRRTLLRITHGLPQLRTLRQIMEEVYRLFDRRCRCDTALAKLAKLRHRVRCFKQVGKTLQTLFSPTLEKSLTFLDDKLLPSTSNAVERGNRRHRKMQKTVYRVRTRLSLHRRMALDLLRDRFTPARTEATQTLHQARLGSG
jgi:hypothetical protein